MATPPHSPSAARNGLMIAGWEEPLADGEVQYFQSDNCSDVQAALDATDEDFGRGWYAMHPIFSR